MTDDCDQDCDKGCPEKEDGGAPNYEVEIYIDDGRVFSYDVPNPQKGREHAGAIIKTGFRHTTEEGDLEWYPVHRIVKVKATKACESSKYIDRVRAT